MTRMIPVDKIEQYRRLIERKARIGQSIQSIKDAGEYLWVANSDGNGNLHGLAGDLSGAELAQVVIAKLNDMIVEADIEMENLCVDTDE